jgi:hypothetical protein
MDGMFTKRLSRELKSVLRKGFDVLIGLMLLPALLHAYMYRMFSQKWTYDQIRLGDPATKVEVLLDSRGVSCDIPPSYPRETSFNFSSCWFTDPWRVYQISFDSETGVVVAKSIGHYPMTKGPHALILIRILRYVLEPARTTSIGEGR